MTPRNMYASRRSSTRGSRGLILLALLTPLVRADGLLFPFVVPKAFFLQMVVALALAVAAVDVLRGGPPRAGSASFRVRRDPVFWAFAAFVAVACVSAVFGSSPSRGLLGTLERRWGVLTWTSFLGLYVLLRVYLDGRLWRRALQISVVVSVAVALYGLLRATGLWPGQQAVVGWSRIESTLGNAGYLGAYMVLGLASTWYLAVRSRGCRWKVLYGLAGILQLAALLGSGTRAAVVGMAAALLVLVAVWSVAAGEATARRVVGFLVLLLAAVGASVFLTTAGNDVHVSSAWDRLLTVLSPETSSARFRLIAWSATSQEIGIRPLLGAGPETFEQVWSRHFDPVVYHMNSDPVLDRAHNVIVHVAVTSGGLGVLAYLATWAVVARNVFRGWHGGRLSGPAASALAFGMISYFVYLLFWFEDHSSFLSFVVLAGLAGHAASTADGSRSDPLGSDRDAGERDGGLHAVGRFGVPALLLALAALLVWHNVRVLDTARNAWDGEYAMDAWEGAERYQDALAAGLPGSEPILQAYIRRLTFLVSRGDSGSPEGPSPRIEEALAAADRALDGWEAREPENPWVHVRRSRLCSLKEDVFQDGRGRSCARRELERAVELSPRRIRYRHWLADHHLSAGDPDRALEVLDGALQVYGSFGETYFYRARVHWTVGNREAAVRQSRLATSLGWAGQPSPFVQALGRWLVEEGRPAGAAELVENHLGLRYTKLRHPALPTEPGRGFEPWDLSLAGWLPILHLRAGDTEAAIRTAEFVVHRMASDGGDGEKERIEGFIEDVRAGRLDRWEGVTSLVGGGLPEHGESPSSGAQGERAPHP